MTDLSTDLQSSLAGTYTLERELGGGGMSRVFVATEHALHRRVVIKVLPSDLGIELSAERFAREIKLAAGLQHPCIVPVLTAGSANGVPFYTMPFVEGMTLRDRLHAQPRLPLEETIGVLRDVASALTHAHARGIVHRDIKPENILLSGGYAQVTDFGIARAISESRTASQPGPGGTRITQAGFVIGSPAYMAPEQVAGAEGQDQRADIYALGCLAYELLAGVAPFSGADPHLVLRAHVSETPVDIQQRRPDVPPDVASVIMRCLEKDRALRPQHAEELVEFFRAPRVRLKTPPARKSIPVAVVQRVPRWAWYMTFTTALAAVGVSIFALLPREPVAHSVAVLPFANLGGDTSQAFFSDGIADDLTSALSEIPGLRVASRTSAFSFKGKAVDPREIGRQLDVSEVLEGSVRRTGAGLRVNASLIRTRDGVSTWSKTFDRPDTDLFAVQDEITRSIAQALRIKWQPDPAGRQHTPPLAAHEAYLRGEANLDQSSEPALRRAIAFFNQAIAIDSEHAQAHAGLAIAYTYLADAFAPPGEAYPQAIHAANRALALDSVNADAEATLGFDVLAYNADFEAGKALMDKALRSNPNSSRAYEYLSFYEAAMRRSRRAVAAGQHALRLDPLSALASCLVEWWFLMAREPDSAIAQHKVTMRIAPSGFTYLDSFIGEAYRQKGMHREALAEYEQASRALGHMTPGHIVALHALGRTPEARKALADLEASWPAVYVPPELIAGVHVRLGDFDGAMTWLEKGVETKSGLSPLIGLLFDLTPLHEDPRFEALLERVGIPPRIEGQGRG